ncbi:hypothetical protein OK006_9017 [Actinobacteria bacterium OK006]|nr:hypothetical protein OK006_9017 [Actinobacteria bacterium OK006]
MGSGQDTAQRNAVSVRHARAFQALFAAVDRGTPGHFAASGSLRDGAVHGDLVEDEADDPIVGVQRKLITPRPGSNSDTVLSTQRSVTRLRRIFNLMASSQVKPVGGGLIMVKIQYLGVPTALVTLASARFLA